MTDQQRKGQRLINYIRFVKKKPFYIVDMPLETVLGEQYLWNMSDEEFDKVVNADWEELEHF